MPSVTKSPPDPTAVHPVPAHRRIVFLRPLVDAPNVEIGEFTYYDDPVAPERFYEKCVLHHFPFIGDRLVIGRYTAIATGVTFIMNGANHAMTGFSTFPFPVFGGSFATASPPGLFESTSRGDTVVGNDVWIGHQATIMPGVTISDGAVIGAKAVVARDVPPYAVAAGNPARVVRMRFPDAVIRRLLALEWWNWPAEKVSRTIPAIVGADIEALERAGAEQGP